jgi:hypothetical protein
MEVEELKTAIEVIKQVEKKTGKKILVPKGLKYCTSVIAQQAEHLQSKKYIDDAIQKQFQSLEDKLFQKLDSMNLGIAPSQVDEETKLTESPMTKKRLKWNSHPKQINKKPTWKKETESDEITVLQCSNGHMLTIFSDTEGQRVAHIDDEENQVVTDSDIATLKEQIEAMPE